MPSINDIYNVVHSLTKLQNRVVEQTKKGATATESSRGTSVATSRASSVETKGSSATPAAAGKGKGKGKKK